MGEGILMHLAHFLFFVSELFGRKGNNLYLCAIIAQKDPFLLCKYFL